MNLRNPESMYRPVPFWSWNEKLSPEELRWQIQEMKKVGLGGFFMHARGGLQTGYLSDEWMDCVKACLDEAAKLDMNAWLYDENGWPSGFGGGLVNGLGINYQQKYLRHEIIDAADAAGREHTIAFYSEDGSKLLGKELPAGTTGKVLRCYFLVNQYYVDNLDAKIVAEFIRVTHQHYYETLPAELRSHLRGIFTDEPQLSRNGLLWSFVLEDEYEKEYGRKLLPELPLLFTELPGFEAMRVRFWRLCAKLFTEHFMHQIRNWCDAHGWWLTGHHVLEETCQSQLSSNGSIMAQYRYYNIPGIDHLCRSLPHPVMMTQVASSAAQFGQKQILTESFALTGWNCNFTGQRWIYHTELAHGVNFLCQHLQGYSLRGLRKRDYPSSNFYHQPWWKDYKVINDYFSRAGMLLAEGDYQPDVLVIHPQSSVWMQYDGDERKDGLNYYSDTLRKTTVALDALQIGHHYADEIIVESVGSVTKGQFKIGLCSYKVVVIPAIMNLSRKIYDLLVKFQSEGGVVYRVKNTKHPGKFYIDGEVASQKELAWFQSLPEYETEEAAAEDVAALQPDRVVVMENGAPVKQVVSTWRTLKNVEGRSGRFYFFGSLKYTEDSQLRISLPATGEQVEMIDAFTGDFKAVKGVVKKDGRFEFDCPLPACGGLMLFVNEKTAADAMVDLEALYSATSVKQLCSCMTLKSAQDNILTLDRCRYRVDGGDWQFTDVIQLQSRLVLLKRDLDLEMEFEFTAADDYDMNADLYLGVETPDRFQFTLNGVAFPAMDLGYVFDKSFRRIALPKNVKVGKNVIGMRTTYHQPQWLYDKLEAAKKFETEYNMLTFDTEMESIYLLGAFSVRHNGDVETLPREAVRYNGTFEIGASLIGKSIDGKDFVASGYPFFAGVATMSKTFELTADEVKAAKILRFAPQGANSWKVTVNGKDAGTCYWAPYAVCVEGLLKEGENTVEFELTQSLRNMLGPHHLQEGESYAVHTMSFNREENFVGHRPPAYNEGYCFVEIGLKDIALNS